MKEQDAGTDDINYPGLSKRQPAFFAGLRKQFIVLLSPFLLIVIGVSIFALPTYLKKWRLRDVRPRAMQQTMQQGEPLIAAIRKYTKEWGKPPPDLNSLIPRYMKSLPDAGPMAKNGWHYEVSEDSVKGGWALIVIVPEAMSDNDWLSFRDYFVYHASENYNRYSYGGVLVRNGKWGYYYE